MARKFEKISLDEFKTKLYTFWNKTEKDNQDSEYFNSDITSLSPEIESDLSKVSFSTENFECDKKYNWDYHKREYEKEPSKTPENDILGFSVLPNGMPILGCSSGGDWEYPLFLLIYWNGKKFRAYIPKDGNTWNTATKKAYGNDVKADIKNLKFRYGKEILEERDEDDFDVSVVPDWDVPKIIKDIQERILENE